MTVAGGTSPEGTGPDDIVRVELAIDLDGSAEVDAITGRIWTEVPGVLAVAEPVVIGVDPVVVWLASGAVEPLRAVVGFDVPMVAVPETSLPPEPIVESIPIPIPAPVGSAGSDLSVEIELDPQRIFGRGDHPTTRMALETLAGLVRPGCSVLDVGTGSGVLAVAAAMLGAGEVVAVDLDPAAVETAAANAERNGVGRIVRVVVGDRPEMAAAGRRFDVVVANLSAATIVALAGELVAVASPGGLVLTGVLADQAGSVDRVVAGASVAAESDGWVLLRA